MATMKKAIFGLMLGALLVLPTGAWAQTDDSALISVGAQDQAVSQPPSDAEAPATDGVGYGYNSGLSTIGQNDGGYQFAQESIFSRVLRSFLGVVLICIFIIPVYVYIALCVYKYGKKTQSPHAWWGWVPILNTFEFVRATGQSYWWILGLVTPLVLGFFVPFVGIISAAVEIWLFAKLCIRFKKSGWLSLLLLVPIAQIILPGYLAFSE